MGIEANAPVALREAVTTALEEQDMRDGSAKTTRIRNVIIYCALGMTPIEVQTLLKVTYSFQQWVRKTWAADIQRIIDDREEQVKTIRSFRDEAAVKAWTVTTNKLDEILTRADGEEISAKEADFALKTIDRTEHVAPKKVLTENKTIVFTPEDLRRAREATERIG